MLTFATLISRIFEPAILLSGALVACALRLGVSPFWAIMWLAILLVPTLAYRFWMKRREGLDWDIKDRKRRVKPMTLLLGYLTAVSALVWVFEPRLLSLFALFSVWVLGFLAITAFVTKISGHAGGDALAVGMMISYYGWSWWPILLIVPVIAWARVVRKDHTLGQVTLGAVYSWGIIGLVTLLRV